MSTNIQKAILQVKVEGQIIDAITKSNAENVEMSDGRMLSAFIADYITADEVNTRFGELIGAAPEALDTLEEIAAKLAEDDDLHDILVSGLASKVTVAEMEQRIAQIPGYIHPETHSADMIVESADRQFMTQAEKTKLASTGRILVGTNAPADMTEKDLFLKLIM